MGKGSRPTRQRLRSVVVVGGGGEAAEAAAAEGLKSGCVKKRFWGFGAEQQATKGPVRLDCCS